MLPVSLFDTTSWWDVCVRQEVIRLLQKIVSLKNMPGWLDMSCHYTRNK